MIANERTIKEKRRSRFFSIQIGIDAGFQISISAKGKKGFEESDGGLLWYLVEMEDGGLKPQVFFRCISSVMAEGAFIEHSRWTSEWSDGARVQRLTAVYQCARDFMFRSNFWELFQNIYSIETLCVMNKSWSDWNSTSVSQMAQNGFCFFVNNNYWNKNCIWNIVKIWKPHMFLTDVINKLVYFVLFFVWLKPQQ